MSVATVRQTSFVLLYFILNNLCCSGDLIIVEQSAPRRRRHWVNVLYDSLWTCVPFSDENFLSPLWRLSSFYLPLHFCIEMIAFLYSMIHKEQKPLGSENSIFSGRSCSPSKAADGIMYNETTKSSRSMLVATSSLSHYLLISLLGLFSWKGSRLRLGKSNRQNWAQQLERQWEPCRKHGKDEWLCR